MDWKYPIEKWSIISNVDELYMKECGQVVKFIENIVIRQMFVQILLNKWSVLLFDQSNIVKEF